MISYLIYSTISMGVLLLFYHAVLIKEKMYHINRGFLLFSIVFSLAIPLVPVGVIGPLLPFDQTVLPAAERSEPMINSESYNAVSGFEGEINDPVVKLSAASIDLFIPILIGIYVAISLFLFVRLLRIIHMIQMKSNRNPRTLFEGCEVVLLNENVVPHTFLNTIFVNKKQFEKGNISREILLHEFTHAKQKHSIDILYIEMLKIFFWFNPVLYLYKRAIHLNHEFLADEAVLKSGIPVSDYQQTLLRTLLYKPSHTLASSLNFGLTKKRLQMMNQSINKTRSIMKIASLIPLFLALSLLLGCESTPAEADSPVKNITIELTDSEIIIINGEEIHVTDLEDKLEKLSKNHELHFLVKAQPEMKTGPVFTVNSLVHKYGSAEVNKRLANVQIDIKKSNEILVDGDLKSAIELEEKLLDLAPKIDLIISMRVERGADTQIIRDVQKLVRSHNISRVNYSAYGEKHHDELTLPSEPIAKRNLLSILINAQGMLLINEQPGNLPELKNRVKDFIGNHGADTNLSESPNLGIITIKRDRRTPYDTYTEVIDKIMTAYDELRDEAARERFGVPFSSIEENSERYREIRDTFPQRITIAETGN